MVTHSVRICYPTVRYNAVFHMVTAADGASAFYSLENNQARTETPEQAIDLDKRTQKCWLGHAHM